MWSPALAIPRAPLTLDGFIRLYSRPKLNLLENDRHSERRDAERSMISSLIEFAWIHLIQTMWLALLLYWMLGMGGLKAVERRES